MRRKRSYLRVIAKYFMRLWKVGDWGASDFKLCCFYTRTSGLLNKLINSFHSFTNSISCLLCSSWNLIIWLTIGSRREFDTLEFPKLIEGRPLSIRSPAANESFMTCFSSISRVGTWRSCREPYLNMNGFLSPPTRLAELKFHFTLSLVCIHILS